jgi:hypothetical protein
MIVLLYCNIQSDSFHESIYFNTVLEIEIISRKGQLGFPSLHKCGLVPQVGSTLGINRYEIVLILRISIERQKSLPSHQS